MNEIHRIRGQFRRAYEGPAWHGPSIRECLEGVTPVTAAAKPVANSHSIWELVLHIIAWEGIAVRRIRGEAAEATPEMDWPATPETVRETWAETLAALEASHAGLREAMIALTDDDLEKPVPGADYNIYFLLHGVIQHNLYHAGQMMMLKRALS